MTSKYEGTLCVDCGHERKFYNAEADACEHTTGLTKTQFDVFCGCACRFLEVSLPAAAASSLPADERSLEIFDAGFSTPAEPLQPEGDGSMPTEQLERPKIDLHAKVREAVELERVQKKDADWNRGYNEAIEDALHAIDRTFSAWAPAAATPSPETPVGGEQ